MFITKPATRVSTVIR